jgi:hypothetical protein
MIATRRMVSTLRDWPPSCQHIAIGLHGAMIVLAIGHPQAQF